MLDEKVNLDAAFRAIYGYVDISAMCAATFTLQLGTNWITVLYLQLAIIIGHFLTTKPDWIINTTSPMYRNNLTIMFYIDFYMLFEYFNDNVYVKLPYFVWDAVCSYCYILN